MSAKPIYTVTLTFSIGEYQGEWDGAEEKMSESATILCQSPSREYAELFYQRLRREKAESR